MNNNAVKLSSDFKTHTKKAIFSIILFAVSYLILLILAIGLTILSAYGGILLIVSFPRLITIALGIGLASFGFLILFFLLKFIFKTHKNDQSHLMEIKKEDEPKLFKMIEEIVNEIQTNFPKKVFLSADVNASVFYNSSFLSMFFPIKKNLQIGMGLINTISELELKAILSHEFGHFSQKTMKVGSFVYNVNQIIHNLLYDNDSYDDVIQKWGNISGYFSIFVLFAIKIIQGIQWILKLLYGIVNKNYMALSREMEFHADEIAANITGYEPLQQSLLRMELADHTFHSVLSFYEGKIPENLKSENIYTEQSYLMRFLANENDIPIVNNYAQVTLEEMNKFNKSKLIIKDQWASHPSVKDRIESLEKTNLNTDNITFNPAADVFTNFAKTQKAFTQKLFKEVKYPGETEEISVEKFKTLYQQELNKYSFPKIFNTYYDNKNPNYFDIEKLDFNKTNQTKITDLFSDEKIDLIYTTLALNNDIEVIKQIQNKTIPIKTFDYDGKKYTRKEAKSLLKTLTVSLDKLNKDITQNDINIFVSLVNLEKEQKQEPKLKNLYTDYFNFDKEFDTKIELYTKITNKLQFISFTTPHETIIANFKRISKIETELKKEINYIIEGEIYQSEISSQTKSNFEKYTATQLTYFQNDKYIEQNLEILFTAINDYLTILNKGYVLYKKSLLEYQNSLIKTT